MSSGGNPASIPTQWEDNLGDDRWISLHKRFVAEAQEKEPEVVFIGDSNVAYLSYTDMWFSHFVPMHSLNFGIGSERVEHVLWRVSNGEVDYMSPKAVVVQVGTNNHGCTGEQIAEGIMTIVDAIRDKQPHAYILVLTLLPRGEKPNPLRERNALVNSILSKELPKKEKTQLVNIDPGFVQADGTISHHDMWDYLHLSKAGYYRAFEPVHELLQQLLSEENEKTPEVNASG